MEQRVIRGIFQRHPILVSRTQGDAQTVIQTARRRQFAKDVLIDLHIVLPFHQGVDAVDGLGDRVVTVELADPLAAGE